MRALLERATTACPPTAERDLNIHQIKLPEIAAAGRRQKDPPNPDLRYLVKVILA